MIFYIVEQKPIDYRCSDSPYYVSLQLSSKKFLDHKPLNQEFSLYYSPRDVNRKL